MKGPSFRQLSNTVPHASPKAKTKPRHANETPQRRNRGKPKETLSPNQIQKQLVHRLQFFFSDVNLRHDSYARSLLVECKYLPLSVLMSFNSIKRLTDDTDLMLKSAMSLGLESKSVDAELMIGRSVPFDYQASIKQSASKIMIVSGWPVEINTRWIEERLRSLLEAGYVDETTNNKTITDDATKAKTAALDTHKAIVYWGKRVADGIITMEFVNDATATKAWDILQSMTQIDELSLGEVPHPAELICDFVSDRKAFLYVGDVKLTVQEMALESTADMVDQTIKMMEKSKIESIEQQTAKKTAEEVVAEDTAPATTPEKKKWWTNKQAAPSLSRCIKAINQLYDQHLTLPPPPRDWLHESRFNKRLTRTHVHMTDEELEHRRELCADVAQIVGRVHNSIARGVIRALGSRDAYAMSDFLNRAMLILSQSPPKRKSIYDELPADSLENNISPYEACLDALNVLRSLNLDIHPHHYSYAIRSACHEFRWEDAANLFLGQIEGDDGHFLADGIHDAAGGFVPLDATLGWDQPLEMGLYAVAINARMPKLPIAESEDNGETSPSAKVFDTAMKMSMIAPTGQESYVLAAGSVLGRAGLWEDCLDFATDPNNISKYGPSIAAAAMLACIESHRSAEAIELYNFFFDSENQSTASEWQWAGGNLSAAKPLFDDLLLRAFGGPSSGGQSVVAIQKFCDMVDDNTPFSSDALVGLMHSMEHDGDWKNAIKLLETFCDLQYRNKEKKWHLVNKMLSLSGIDEVDDANTLTKSQLEDLTANLLASTMRTCNKEGFFSLSILLSSIVHSFVDEDFAGAMLLPDDESTTQAVASHTLLSSKPLRNAYIHSLSKVGLRRLVHTMESSANDINSPRNNKLYPAAGESMLNAFVATNQVLIALDDIRRSKKRVSRSDEMLISRGLSSAMKFYLDASHPASAMHLFNYASKTLNVEFSRQATNNVSSFSEKVTSFFGDNRSEPKAASLFQDTESSDYKILRLNDSLLSSVMRAYTMMGQPEKALTILKEVQEDTGSASWDTIQSFNQALEVLLESDVDEFMTFLEDSSGLVMPSTFLALARKYAREGAWPEIGELYNEARRRGCISEELGLIAMQAVCEAQLDTGGKILVLRKISDDISNTVGMKKTKEWLDSQYWHIKRYTGFHYARVSASSSTDHMHSVLSYPPLT
jgi:tetratricopeptide (TPR) repeat protein